jgi:leucyl aminopeptidase
MIEMMKFDMGGLGAVLGAATAVSAIDASSAQGSSLFDGIELHFISAVCENMISRDAMRPGDIVTASNGKTIEIINTGRFQCWVLFVLCKCYARFIKFRSDTTQHVAVC